MLQRSGKLIKKDLVEAARSYLNFYTDGRVPYKEVATGKIHYVVFEKCGVAWLFKELASD